MLAALAARCRENDGICAGMLYGSLALGEADSFSDLDVVLFVGDDVFNTLAEQRAWLEGIAPVLVYCVNEFGVPNAIFDNLVRGEFHFEKASAMAQIVAGWQGVWLPSPEAAIIVDKNGALARCLQPLIGEPLRHAPNTAKQQDIADNCCNWIVFGLDVLQRGERLRALEILGFVHRHLLWLARIRENSTIHWFTPSRMAERELSPQTLSRFAACAATTDAATLWPAYAHAWAWLKELCGEIQGVSISSQLDEKILAILKHS